MGVLKVSGDEQGSRCSPPEWKQQGQDVLESKRSKGEERGMPRSDQRVAGRKPGGGTAGTVGQTVAESNAGSG